MFSTEKLRAKHEKVMAWAQAAKLEGNHTMASHWVGYADCLADFRQILELRRAAIKAEIKR